MAIRLLAVDLDGTLLDSRWQLSDVNARALRKAHALGVHIAFVTGRRYTFTRPHTAAFDFRHYLITSAGASTRTGTGERLFRHPLRSAAAQEFLTFARAIASSTFLVSDVDGAGEILCHQPRLSNPHVARYLEANRAFITEVENLGDGVGENLLQIALLGGIDEMKQAVGLIESFPQRSEFNLLRTEYPARDFALLDVLDAGINKGLALAELAQYLDVDRSEIMAIGDNHNDLDMLTFAGLPVIMANAQDDLRTYGWPMTGSNDDHGVAQAIDRFILSGR